MLRCRANHCLDVFMESYAFANRTVSMLLGCEQDLIEWGPPWGQPVNECVPSLPGQHLQVDPNVCPQASSRGLKTELYDDSNRPGYLAGSIAPA